MNIYIYIYVYMYIYIYIYIIHVYIFMLYTNRVGQLPLLHLHPLLALQWHWDLLLMLISLLIHQLHPLEQQLFHPLQLRSLQVRPLVHQLQGQRQIVQCMALPWSACRHLFPQGTFGAVAFGSVGNARKSTMLPVVPDPRVMLHKKAKIVKMSVNKIHNNPISNAYTNII